LDTTSAPLEPTFQARDRAFLRLLNGKQWLYFCLILDH